MTPANRPDHPLDPLLKVEKYRRMFTDAVFWAPFVREVCRRHGLVLAGQGLEPYERVRVGIPGILPGNPGSMPAFIVEERWLVKFFGVLFGGQHSFQVEQAAAHLLAQMPEIPVPAVAASGYLEKGDARCPWPYIVFEFLPGVSIGEVFGQIPVDEKLRVAGQLGRWVRALHGLRLPKEGVFRQGKEEYETLLYRQRALCAQHLEEWGSLPEHLLDEVEDFVPHVDELLPAKRMHLIHADLTRDHLLGRLEAGRWTTLGLIDFGDARVGELFYELQALHLDMFWADKGMLAAFLDAYGYRGPRGTAFAQRAMAFSLLHEFNVLERLEEKVPRAGGASSLDELAEMIWGI